MCHFVLDAPMFTVDEKQEMIIANILAVPIVSVFC